MTQTTPPAAAVDEALAAEIGRALRSGSLPGEIDGMDGDAIAQAARLLAETAAARRPGRPAIAFAAGGGAGGAGARRRMRLALINDDMPFLVDSVAAALGARGLEVHRLLHPVLAVRRDEAGRPVAASAQNGGDGLRESMIYMEVDRTDARVRRVLGEELETVLADVAAAVADRSAMAAALQRDAAALDDGEAEQEGEGAALLRWFDGRHFTLLGHVEEDRGGVAQTALGLCRQSGPWLWNADARAQALARFAAGGDAPVLVKSPRDSTVHRRVPLDLVVSPITRGGALAGLSIHAGLWTSTALAEQPDRVPVLRARLAGLFARYGFDPSSHAGRALHHALASLPHDLLLGVAPDALERLALTAMSLADRPRPKLLLAPATIGPNLFAFVWLPREEFGSTRRVAIGELICGAAGGRITSWSSGVDDGDLAFFRYTITRDADAPLPDARALDAALGDLVRGWAPSVEEALAPLAGPSRATRLAISYAAAFPPAYRDNNDPRDAAEDIMRLRGLAGEGARGVRLFRRPGDAADRLRLKTYRLGGAVTLSAAVPVLENFGFGVVEEVPTALTADLGSIHEFTLAAAGHLDLSPARLAVAEGAIAAVLDGTAENDPFNQLILAGGLGPRDVVLLRAWFRYLRQTGLSNSLATVVDALRRAPAVTQGLVAWFHARHDPAAQVDEAEAAAAIEAGLAGVAAIDDDRILRRFRAVVAAVLRTNAFVPASVEALAFKLDPALIPGLPDPRPWREIWVYSPRVEGIHLRGGPIARGGLRWSDRRDDFRTEILGLMKAQLVKNAVIVPTGAKGGFVPKRLPPPGDRDAWLAEGTESYRVFIRTLLSVTDNLVAGALVHPAGMVVRDGADPYFVVAADKGTASFSDTANAIALDRGFWLGDAFASGGSAGYDHKAMGITARGAWVSVARHFAELGIDVQTDPVRVAGCGDMSGDVFGNGMLLSKSIRLVAAFDHRHIFLDPDPDPAVSWAERARLFALPRSSWADYDPALISAGGGVFPRSQKAIPLSPEARAALGVAADTVDPSALIAAILKAPVDLLWFGGIGTYIKGEGESHAEVGDPANDAHRINGGEVRAKAIGEGANLSTTQAGRIEFAGRGGRINTDFVDNSAGVDCSDNEVNIKIPLNREMAEGRLARADRDRLLASMTDEVAALVLDDNRLQALALSLAEQGGAAALPSMVRLIETLESAGRFDRAVEGLAGNEALLRRAQDGQGLTRPELAVLMSHAKIALQAAIEAAAIDADPAAAAILAGAFPQAMRDRFAPAIDAHPLRREIVATKLANRVVNRLGFVMPFELAEQEGTAIAQVATAYLVCDAVFDLDELWCAIEAAEMAEDGRTRLFGIAAEVVGLHLADLLRLLPVDALPSDAVAELKPGLDRLASAAPELLREEARTASRALGARLGAIGAPAALATRLVALADLDGAFGVAGLAARLGFDETAATEAYVRLGEALGLDWAKAAALRLQPSDPWERLLAAGLARDFEQLRLGFLGRASGGDPQADVAQWLAAQAKRVDQFRRLVDRARSAPATGVAMLAQLASQARVLLER